MAEPTLGEIAREWGRIGAIGFGGPPAHLALFRELCVTRRQWLAGDQFERAIAATNILPGLTPPLGMSSASCAAPACGFVDLLRELAQPFGQRVDLLGEICVLLE